MPTSPPTSTARSCSTRTRVASLPISISGRKVASLAFGRGGSDEHRREFQKFVDLNDHGISAPSFLVPATSAPRQPDLVNVAAIHPGQSAPSCSISRSTASHSAESCGSAASTAALARKPERRSRRSADSTRAARTASDSLRPSPIRTESAGVEGSSRRARTVLEAMIGVVAQAVLQSASRPGFNYRSLIPADRGHASCASPST